VYVQKINLITLGLKSSQGLQHHMLYYNVRNWAQLGLQCNHWATPTGKWKLNKTISRAATGVCGFQNMTSVQFWNKCVLRFGFLKNMVLDSVFTVWC